MTGRGPARLLAPLALGTTILALVLIVSPGGEETGADRAPDEPPATTPAGNRGRDRDGAGRDRRGRGSGRTYTVKPGDTPSGIADRTGVPLDRLLELNPDVDPQLLSPGQRLKLEE